MKQTATQLPKKIELDQKNKAKRQETQKSDSTDVNESSMSGKFWTIRTGCPVYSRYEGSILKFPGISPEFSEFPRNIPPIQIEL